MAASVTFIVVKDGRHHRVVAPLVGDSLRELEEKGRAAVDTALDSYVTDASFNGRIVIAFQDLHAKEVEVERARIEAELQARADAFGGVTVLGKKLAVTVTVGLQAPDPPLEHEVELPKETTSEVAARTGSFDDPMPKFFQEGYALRDTTEPQHVGVMKVFAVLVAILTGVLVFTGQPWQAWGFTAGVAAVLVVAIVVSSQGRVLELYSDRFEIVDGRKRRIVRYAEVDAFMFKTEPIPDRLILTKKSILVRYRPSRGGDIVGADGHFYDEQIDGEFEPLGAMAIVVVMNFRLDRWRKDRA